MANPRRPESTITARILFDSGSYRTYITEELAEKLKLRCSKPEHLQLATFGSSSVQHVSARSADITLHLENKEMRQLRVTVVPNITSNITTAPLDQNLKLNLPRDIDIAETEYKASQTQGIDIPIGNDYYLELVLPERHQLAPGLYALNTSLGWIVSGRTHLMPAEPSQMSTPSLLVIDGCQTESNVMDKPQLERFWDLETIGIMDSPHISDDETAQALFSKSVTFENGRYNVSWPWKPDRELPDNYMLAKGRLTSLIRRLRRDPDMLKRYDDVIQDQLTKGIKEEAPPVQSSHRLHYLPHHHVISPSSTTTKLRIVMFGVPETGLLKCTSRRPEQEGGKERKTARDIRRRVDI